MSSDLALTSASQPVIHDSNLQDKVAIAKELNAELAPLYDQQKALSIPLGRTAVPADEKAARAALVSQVQDTVHKWEGDHNTWGADEVKDGDRVVQALTNVINNPAFKLADVTGLVNKVLQNPNGNTDYLGGDGHVGTSIINQINELAQPLQVDANASEAARKSQLNEVNSKIADLKSEFSQILGTAAPASPHDNNTYNISNSGNTANSSDVSDYYANAKMLAQFSVPLAQPLSPLNRRPVEDDESKNSQIQAKLGNLQINVRLNFLPESVVISTSHTT